MIKRIFPKELYHGTDSCIFYSSDEERTRRRILCSDISEYLYQKFVADGMSVYRLTEYKKKRIDQIGNIWFKFCDSFQKYDSFRNKSPLYEYDSFYVTNSKARAERYARSSFVFGEKGDIAFWLYNTAIKVWDIKAEMNCEMQNKAQQFEIICNEKPNPIIIVFENVPEQWLLREDGKEIDWNTEEVLFLDNDIQLSLRCVFDCTILERISRIIKVE